MQVKSNVMLCIYVDVLLITFISKLLFLHPAAKFNSLNVSDVITGELRG